MFKGRNNPAWTVVDFATIKIQREATSKVKNILVDL
jgi:hypothetical protein